MWRKINISESCKESLKGNFQITERDARLIEAIGMHIITNWEKRASRAGFGAHEEFVSIHDSEKELATQVMVAVFELVNTVGETGFVPATYQSLLKGDS